MILIIAITSGKCSISPVTNNLKADVDTVLLTMLPVRDSNYVSKHWGSKFYPLIKASQHSMKLDNANG